MDLDFSISKIFLESRASEFEKYLKEHPELPSPILEDGSYMSLIDWLEELSKYYKKLSDESR